MTEGRQIPRQRSAEDGGGARLIENCMASNKSNCGDLGYSEATRGKWASKESKPRRTQVGFVVKEFLHHLKPMGT